MGQVADMRGAFASLPRIYMVRRISSKVFKSRSVLTSFYFANGAARFQSISFRPQTHPRGPEAALSNSETRIQVYRCVTDAIAAVTLRTTDGLFWYQWEENCRSNLMSSSRASVLDGLAHLPTINGINTSEVLLSLDAQVQALADATDSMWILMCSLSVFFMQAGFGMLESGSVQEKNMRSILFKNILDLCVTGFIFFVFGYGIAFGASSTLAPVFGWETPFRNFVAEPSNGYAYVTWMNVFAATCATIVSGAVAERTHLAAYLWMTLVLSTFVTPTVMHWIWSSKGWLSGSNPASVGGLFVIDFAGSGVVHMVGGIAALQAAKAVGPRLRPARFDKDGVREIAGSNASLSVLGTLILWFCWFGFNAGGAFLVSTKFEFGGENDVGCIDVPFLHLCEFLRGYKTAKYAMASQAVINTALAPMCSCIMAVLTGWIVTGVMAQWKLTKLGKASSPHPFSSIRSLFLFLAGARRKGKLDLSNMTNGILIGTVSITGGCVTLTTGAAALCGCIAGVSYVFLDLLLLAAEVDDPVNASVVHAGGGSLGLLFAAFSNEAYVRRAFNRDYLGLGRHLLSQLLGIVALGVWSGVVTYIFFGIATRIIRTDKTVRENVLRIPLELEEWGMDVDLNWGIRRVKLRPTLADYLSRVGSERPVSSPFDEMTLDSFLNLPTSKAICRFIVDRYRPQFVRHQDALEGSSSESQDELVYVPTSTQGNDDVLSGSGSEVVDETVSYSV